MAPSKAKKVISTVKRAATGKHKAKASWNDMLHLSVKRFADNQLTTAGARRDRKLHPYPAIAEIDPSGRSKCKHCGTRIEKYTLRLGIMMECEKGYRHLCTLHEECFLKHRDTAKLEFTDIHFKDAEAMAFRNEIKSEFADFKKKNSNQKNKL